MDRRKELKQQYKETRRSMGIFVVRSNLDSTCYVEAAQELKGAMNSTKFKLRHGSHPNRELQAAWNAHGEASFTMEILETLAYDETSPKTDYSDDLALLCTLWQEKLVGENMALYAK